MARLAVLCLLAAVCCAAVGAAADPKLMVSDVLVSSKSTKARTSSYYDDTELACMAQLNFKNCRYTGCPGMWLLSRMRSTMLLRIAASFGSRRRRNSRRAINHQQQDIVRFCAYS